MGFSTDYSQELLQQLEEKTNVSWRGKQKPTEFIPSGKEALWYSYFRGETCLSAGGDKSDDDHISNEEFLKRCIILYPKDNITSTKASINKCPHPEYCGKFEDTAGYLESYWEEDKHQYHIIYGNKRTDRLITKLRDIFWQGPSEFGITTKIKPWVKGSSKILPRPKSNREQRMSIPLDMSTWYD